MALLSGCASMPWYKPDRPRRLASAAVRLRLLDPRRLVRATAGGACAAWRRRQARSGIVRGGLRRRPAGPPSAKATADFNRAVNFMRSGNATEAELEFKQMTLAYPRLSTPYVNLGILYRKAGHLDQSEEALKGAVERNGGSAVAWNELGATQRLRGEFPDAAASYEKAIAADSNYAPAYRNLGVVSDLYLGDPERALMALERYKELTGEDRPVTSWIAELRQRTGKPPLKPAGAAPAAAPPSAAGGAELRSARRMPRLPPPAAARARRQPVPGSAVGCAAAEQLGAEQERDAGNQASPQGRRLIVRTLKLAVGCLATLSLCSLTAAGPQGRHAQER